MSVPQKERRDLAARLAILCMPVAAALVFPSAVMAAGSGAGTVRAVVGGDGSVKSIKVYDAAGNAGAFNDSLPLKMSISRSVSGNVSTYSYHVENTYSKTQDVSYTDTAGKQHTTSATVQLPLVAQLGIDVPSSFKDVSAPNGVVMKDPDGTSHVLFNLVLFSPLGSPAQDVTFTASGKGVPTAELAAKAVEPSATPGLSAASQDANSSAQQDDFWTSYATGGNGGLTQLATGMTQIVAGLAALAPGAHQLATGLKAAGAGATKLDAGTKSAYDGSKKLYTGDKDALEGARQLAGGGTQVLDGAKKLDKGTNDAFAGSKKLADGSTQAAAGASKLSDGLGQLAAGQTALNGGLTQIQGGLAQLDASTPAAVTGLTAIEAGVKQILVGLEGVGGSVGTPKTIDGAAPAADGSNLSVLLGLGSAQTNLSSVISPLQTDLATLNTLVAGNSAFQTALADPAVGPAITQLITDLTTDAVPAGTFPAGHPLHNGGIIVQVNGGLQALLAGLQKITTGLDSHTPGTFGSTDAGGVDYGLLALLDPTKGLPAAVAGIHALATGSTSALAGSNQLTAGTGAAYSGSKDLATGVGQVAAGAGQLSSGLGQLATGQDQITAGLEKIAPGQVSLAAGLGQITSGQGQLTDGLKQLSDGQHQVATGLPAAVSGSAQIASGADQLLAGSGKVKDGILAVQSGATQPLVTQLTEGSQNAKKQIAIIDAAGALASQAPGGEGTSYVLTQSPTGFRLAAASSSTGSSNTGRNIGIGLGGLAALVIAVVGGFAMGRRSGRVSA